ncbi:RpoE-regulated lipoprotein [Serratia marcescens]
MNIRPLLLGLPLLLTGCSSMSNFSWSSLSPFNWFGSSLEVGAKGVGKLNAGTPMSESAINDGLDGNYRLRGGMATSNGQIVSYYQALSGDEVKLVITGEPKGRLQRVDVLDPQVTTEWGNKLGTPFGDMYSKAFGSCKPGSGEDAGKVECVAEQSKYVTYIFSGKWAGAQDIIPPDDTLKSWTVSKIIWHAKPQQ